MWYNARISIKLVKQCIHKICMYTCHHQRHVSFYICHDLCMYVLTRRTWIIHQCIHITYAIQCTHTICIYTRHHQRSISYYICHNSCIYVIILTTCHYSSMYPYYICNDVYMIMVHMCTRHQQQSRPIYVDEIIYECIHLIFMWWNVYTRRVCVQVDLNATHHSIYVILGGDHP